MDGRLIRSLAYQGLAAGVLLLGVWLIAANTAANLERLGIDSGTAFLLERSGFEINQKLVAFDADAPVARAIGVAALNTLLLWIVAAVGASALGLLAGIARLSSSLPARALGTAFVEGFRNIPILLQVFFWYLVLLHSLPSVAHGAGLLDLVFLNNRGLFLPRPHLAGSGAWALAALGLLVIAVVLVRRWAGRHEERGGRRVGWLVPWALLAAALVALLGWLELVRVEWTVPSAARFGYRGGIALTPEFLTLAIALSTYNGSYIAEIVRSGLAAVPRGQLEAAEALGLSRARVLRLVLLPQALRTMLPPLATTYQSVLKSSALGAAIAYPELTSVLVGTINNIVGQPVVIMAITLAVYLVLSMLIGALAHWYEARTARWR